MLTSMLAKQSKWALFLFLFSTGLVINSWDILYPKSVGWDVSGFLLTGRRLGDNFELPLIATFDNKPPLTFAFYAIPFFLNLDSSNFLVVWQVLIVTSAITFSLFIFLNRIPIKILYAVGFGFLNFFYSLPTSREWLTEINVLLILSLLFLWWEKSDSSTALFYMVLGVIVSVGIFTRTNLIFVAIFINIYLLLRDRKKRNICIFNVSLLFVALLVCLPYLFSGHLKILFKTLIEIPLYAAADFDFSYLVSKSSLVLMTFPLCLIFITLNHHTRSKTELNRTLFVSFIYGAILIGVLADHPHFAHHNLQLALPTLILVLLFLEKRQIRTSFLHILVFGLFSIFLIFNLLFSYKTYMKDISYETENSVVQKVSKMVNESKCNKEKYLWSVNYNYLNYRLNTNPVHPFMSATNLVNRPFLDSFFGKDISYDFAIKAMIASKPCLIVAPQNLGYLLESQKRILRTALQQLYFQKFESDKLDVVVYIENGITSK